MNCEELKPEYGAYALGIAEEPEAREIAEHLARACSVCLPGVQSALATVAAMSGAVKVVDPPKRLRARVVGMVSPEPRRNWTAVWMPWAVAGALALVLVSIVLPGRIRRQPSPAAESAAISQARFNEVLSILNDPGTRDVSFGEPTARGRFFVSADRGVVFIAAQLPKLAPGRTFEMWVIPANGKPVPAGTFNALSDSTAVHIRPGRIEGAAAMAVSVEPDGGSPQPTTTPFIVTKL